MRIKRQLGSVFDRDKPFVTWIWAGCLLMAIGGLLALSDRRYRFGQRRDARSAERVTA